MTNKEVAKLLREVAAVYLLKEENRFRTIAYERAADTIDASTVDVEDLWKEGKLTSLPGVGSSISSYLEELFKTGEVKHFDSVRKKVPEAMFALLDIPGFGPKRALQLTKELHITSPKSAIDDLLRAAGQGKIARLAGFGEKSQKDIVESIQRFQKGQLKENRITLPVASVIADEVGEYLQRHRDVFEAIPLGSLRRQVATIGDIDFAVSTKNPESVLGWFLKYPKKQELIERGPTGASIVLTNGRQVDVRVQDPKTFGSMVQYFTGSKQHNIHLRELALKQGYSLNEYGIKPLTKSKSKKGYGNNYNKKKNLYEFQKEEGFYRFLGMHWIPPEIREDRGEIEASLANRLPELVKMQDIKGDLHIHTSYDLKPSHDLGSSDLKEILKYADVRKYEYVGISDHNPRVSEHSEIEILSIMKRRKSYYEQIYSSTKSTRVKLFLMLEIDILPDGKLALPQNSFAYIDAAIVSIHSVFNMDKSRMTQRILSGLSHPKAKILGHPTGRLLTKREGYDVDWDEIFTFCGKHNKALEINAYPQRLDLPDDLVRDAIRKGVRLVISTDSHDVTHMDLMRYGVSVARRGWAQKGDILNTLPYNKFKEWLIS
ncbi:hypothetical protein HYW55_02600 [Candidatus Gottesmanbacteria bacterium]|nr:hypothetical protein [Candidatus Gottesmanbacteria bacterium]